MSARPKEAFDQHNWPQPNVGCAVPYAVFTSPEYYAREQAQIFRGETWSFVGLSAELAGAGDYKATFIGETPVIITRDAEGHLHALQNRCAHRGALVCREPRGNADSLQCVYHQWTYDLAGKLRGSYMVPSKFGTQSAVPCPNSDSKVWAYLPSRASV